MKCKACDALLSDFESTRKISGTSEYIDLCNRCFSASGVASVLPIQERADLQEDSDVYDFDEDRDYE